MLSSNRFILKYPEPSEFDKVMGFYTEDPARRTEAVYVRNEEVIKSQLSKRLRVAAYDDNGNIVATSGLQILGEGKTVDCVARTDGVTIEKGRIAELVGVLTMKHGTNDIIIPRGIWNGLLFTLPEIMLWDRALPVDILVANVQTGRTNTINHITGAPSTKSPLRWERFHPAPQLVHAFKSTTHDENADRPKDFYRAPVNNLPEVAKVLLRNIRQGYITNHAGEQIFVDFSQLKLEPTLKAIAEKSWYFKKLLHNGSWSEANRTFEALTPRDMPNRAGRLTTTQNMVGAPTDKLPTQKIAFG